MPEFEVDVVVTSTFRKRISAPNRQAAERKVTQGLTLEAEEMVESQHVSTVVRDENGRTSNIAPFNTNPIKWDAGL